MHPKHKFLFHFTHKETLGHATRLTSLVNALTKTIPCEVYILQGGVPQNFIIFPAKAKIYHIPYPFDSKISFNGPRATVHARERAGFILNIIKEVRPTAFITEFFPFGRLECLPELLPSLHFLKTSKTRIFASIGYPLLSDLIRHKEDRLIKLLPSVSQLFDHIFIHTPPLLENPYVHACLTTDKQRAFYKTFLESIAAKTSYTGYIVPHKILEPSHADPIKRPKGICTVLLSRGSGAVNPKLIANAISAQAILGNKYRLIAVCGPATSATEITFFKQHIKKTKAQNTLLLKSTADLMKLLKDSDISISLCGYNTSVQLMQAQKPAIIIPWQNPTSKDATTDQLARARLLQERFNATIIPYDKLSAQLLAATIKKIHSRGITPPVAPAGWFNGARTMARLVQQKI
ncbi:MAG: hypothetical protein HQL17_00180 [Candidatus Omnitrophica bacterium]|nr:hypothetical protein [Candidatus Omnitrophota bacterium]